ncbi:MAG: hypothetical protein AAFX99_33435 [Myxococcota bacterium]
MNGQEAWEQVKSRVEAMEPPPERLPSWRFDGLQAELMAELGPIQARLDALASVYNQDVSQTFRGLVASTEQLALAGSWALSQFERQIAPETSIRAQARRVETLRRPALHALKMLELFGLVTAAEASAIRRGTGYKDAAGDLQALAPLLQQHWAVLEPLQANIADAELRLSLESIAAMPEAATALLTANRDTNASENDINWRDALRRLSVLLERDWNRLRALTLGAEVALDGLEAPPELRPSVLALYRT